VLHGTDELLPHGADKLDVRVLVINTTDGTAGTVVYIATESNALKK